MEPREAMRKYYLLHYYTQWYSPHSYSLDEVSTYLGVKPETVLSYIASSELPAEAVGNSYRVAVEDLEDFLLTRTKGIVSRRERRCASY